MEPRRFQNSTAGRLLKVGQGEQAYWAFVPNPLPPDLPLDLELWRALSDADRGLGELSGLGRTMPNPQLLIGPFIPFLDGNGRIGRLLISILLAEWKLLSEPLLYLSAFFERNRDEYIGLLLAVSERGAWREWVLFFLRGVAEQSLDASNRAKQLQDLQIRWRQELRQAGISGLPLQIVDSLFEDPFRTLGQVHEQTGYSYPTASAALQKLEKLGIIAEVSGRARRNKLYVASDLLKILE